MDKKILEGDMDWSASLQMFGLLSEPMPAEALSDDKGRGFTLTSIKAGFVLERLNESFGLLGYGWRYTTGPHHLQQAGGKEEVLVEVAFQWRMSNEPTDRYCPPIYWSRTINPQSGAITEGWQFSEKALPHVWSEPIFANGGSTTQRKGSVPMTDAYRAAVTNAITKAASRLGVGMEIFKGQTDDNGQGNSKDTSKSPARQQAGKTPAKRTVKRRSNGGTRNLKALQEMAQAELSKLNIEESAEPNTRLIENLARVMVAGGIEMQPARLIHCLLGEGPFSQKRVMATYNFVTKASLSDAEVALLNKAAFPVGKEAAKEEGGSA